MYRVDRVDGAQMRLKHMYNNVKPCLYYRVDRVDGAQMRLKLLKCNAYGQGLTSWIGWMGLR